jgi:hypothetical protein
MGCGERQSRDNTIATVEAHTIGMEHTVCSDGKQVDRCQQQMYRGTNQQRDSTVETVEAYTIGM